MTTIYYKDTDNEIITNQQVSLLKEYQKIFEVDNVIRKIEYYFNGQVDLEYFKQTGESINDIFTLSGTNSLAITEIEQIGDYTIETSLSYSNGIVKHTEKHLLLNGKIICIHELVTGGQLYCEKYLFDDNGQEIGEEIFRFSYNNDGSLCRIGGKGYPFSSDNESLEAIEVPLYFPNLFIDKPYYVDVDFLPKE